MNVTLPLVCPPDSLHCPQSTISAGSRPIGSGGEPVTTALTMPPPPDADQPRVTAPSTTGSANTPHCGGSAVHLWPNPHSAAGAALPVISDTS